MAELTPGIYERLITEGLRAQLDGLAKIMPVDERPLNSADASDRIAWHVSQQVERTSNRSSCSRVARGWRVIGPTSGLWIIKTLIHSVWREPTCFEDEAPRTVARFALDDRSDPLARDRSMCETRSLPGDDAADQCPDAGVALVGCSGCKPLLVTEARHAGA